jgi:UDP-N-acetylmuramoyl-tripeptide--D-alanyl-D-alanine ligase
MVELGIAQEQENANFGAAAAEVCDYVVLVEGASDKAILKGLQSRGFSSNKVRMVPDLSSATRELGKLMKHGDVVLFENDLPDLYGHAQ